MAIYKNIYKFNHIFTCTHEIHSGFSGKMSVFHILKKRNCFPDGCFYFKWKCKQLNKRHECFRGFTHVGKECFNCKEFYEEKLELKPQVSVDKVNYEEFKYQLDTFEEWLYFNLDNEHPVSGTIDNVKPFFKKIIRQKGEKLIFTGFLLTFKRLFVGMDTLDDLTFIHISKQAQERHQFRAGDRIEAHATMRLEGGRLIFNGLHHIQIEKKGTGYLWNNSKAMVINKSATTFHNQPDGCIECPFGMLVDVEYENTRQGKSKHLVCLKGIQDYRQCHQRAEFCYSDLIKKS